MTKHTKINKFKLAKEKDIALSDLQHHILMKAEKLNQSQVHIKELVNSCVNRDMLMADAILEFQHGNLDEIKNKIAEQRRQNDRLLDDVRLLEWTFMQIKIDEIHERQGK